VIGLGRPFPYISNLSLSLAVLLRDPEAENEVIARVKVPKELLRRFLTTGDGSTFVPLEDVIADNLDALFPGTEVIDYGFFKVTRDADFTVSDEADDLLLAVQDELRRRRFGEVLRLEISAGMNPKLRAQLTEALRIEEREVYESDGLLDLADVKDIVQGSSGHSELRFAPWTPVTQPRLHGEDGEAVDMFAAIRQDDVLVHHPYDSFSTSVERFVEQAVADPDVLAIKMTVYRTSDDSPLVPALIRASERGKQAVCMVELKARFDEESNIQAAKAMEEAGVHVVYGIPGLKTHVKAILIARREGDRVRHYVHVGTGNYNPTTARLYRRPRPVHRRCRCRGRRRRDVQLHHRLRPARRLPQGAGLADHDAQAHPRGDRAGDRRQAPWWHRPDRDEDERAGRRRLHPGPL